MEKVRQFYNRIPYPNSKNFNSDYSWVSPPEQNNMDILDLGCGTGEISNYLSKFGKVIGVDFSENSINIARENYKHIKFLLGDITQINLNKKFDYIYCIGVLHHIPEVKKALINIKKHSKKTTIIVLAVYNKYGMLKNKILRKKFLTKEGYEDFYNNPYAKEYSQKEFQKLLNECGFKILRIDRNFPELFRLLTGKNKLMRFIVTIK